MSLVVKTSASANSECFIFIFYFLFNFFYLQKVKKYRNKRFMGLLIGFIVNKKIKYKQPKKVGQKLINIGNNILKKNLNEINKHL